MAKWLDKYEQGGLILKKKTKDNYGTKPNVNDAKVSAGPNFVGDGYTAYNWKSPAWGGQFQMGGSLPGSVGFMYARTQNPAPSNGKYTKKTQASAQNGQEMKYWQDGLDFKPKSISQNGSWLEKYAMEPKLQDNVRNVILRKMTPEEKKNAAIASSNAQFAKAQHEANVMAERKKNRESQGDVRRSNPNGEFHIEDKFRMFPKSVGGVGEMIDDYLNPLTIIGHQADKLGNSLRHGDMSQYASALGESATLGLLGFDPLGQTEKFVTTKAAPLLKSSADQIYSKYIYPKRYANEIKELEALHSLAPERYLQPEASKRMKAVLGIDPTSMEQPTITTSNVGSHYSPGTNNINIDFDQIRRLKKEGHELNLPSVYEHEYGHFLQREAHRYSDDFANKMLKYLEDVKAYNDPYNQRLINAPIDDLSRKERDDLFSGEVKFKPFKPTPTSKSTKIDKYTKNLYDVDPVINEGTYQEKTPLSIPNARYFTHDVEPMAHLREMRQNMLTKGYIKDLYEPISEGTISKFIAENPKDRISSFTPNSDIDVKYVKGLEKIFRNLPAAAPVAVGAGAVAASKEYAKGGIVDPRGQWAHPGEVTTIPGNDITMKGVDYDVVGVSNTGDKKLMKPGKNYKFDGDYVTEYPKNWLDKYK